MWANHSWSHFKMRDFWAKEQRANERKSEFLTLCYTVPIRSNIKAELYKRLIPSSPLFLYILFCTVVLFMFNLCFLRSSLFLQLMFLIVAHSDSQALFVHFLFLKVSLFLHTLFLKLSLNFALFVSQVLYYFWSLCFSSSLLFLQFLFLNFSLIFAISFS